MAYLTAAYGGNVQPSVLTDTEWRIAQLVCTEKQIEALAWHRRGAGKRRIGQLLNIDPSAAQDRIRAGKRNIAMYLAGEYENPPAVSSGMLAASNPG